MASHKALSMWTHPAEKVCGTVAEILSSCSSMTFAWKVSLLHMLSWGVFVLPFYCAPLKVVHL